MHMNCVRSKSLAYLPQQAAGVFVQISAQLGPAI